MLTKTNISLFVLGLSVYFAFFHQSDFTNENFVKEQFSSNLKGWLGKGKTFIYKEVHQIFYVQEKLNGNDETSSDPSFAILFLHGFPTSSYDFIKLWPQLQSINNELVASAQIKYSSMIAFDYLGYGFSDKPENYEYNIFDMADLAEKLLLHLNIQNVFLIAHDVGDTMALELLRRENLKNQNHFRIDKCVLLNGGIMTSIYKPILSQHIMRNDYLKNIFASYLFKYPFFKYSFRKVFGELNPPSESELYDFFLTVVFKGGNRILPLTINYMTEREQFGDVWLNALNETEVPVMFIYGPADPINPRDTFPAKMRSDLPQVNLKVLSDMVGHYPQYEDPFTVFSLIRQFF
jgi:pimeloyl-ACP methyl ester carboxylesterase